MATLRSSWGKYFPPVSFEDPLPSKHFLQEGGLGPDEKHQSLRLIMFSANISKHTPTLGGASIFTLPSATQNHAPKHCCNCCNPRWNLRVKGW